MEADLGSTLLTPIRPMCGRTRKGCPIRADSRPMGRIELSSANHAMAEIGDLVSFGIALGSQLAMDLLHRSNPAVEKPPPALLHFLLIRPQNGMKSSVVVPINPRDLDQTFVAPRGHAVGGWTRVHDKVQDVPFVGRTKPRAWIQSSHTVEAGPVQTQPRDHRAIYPPHHAELGVVAHDSQQFSVYRTNQSNPVFERLSYDYGLLLLLEHRWLSKSTRPKGERGIGCACRHGSSESRSQGAQFSGSR
jgi:hypothetical protein